MDQLYAMENNMIVLVTGGTGNVGREVIRWLYRASMDINVIAAVRNIERGQETLGMFNNLQYRRFDFDDFSTFNQALEILEFVFFL